MLDSCGYEIDVKAEVRVFVGKYATKHNKNR